MDDPKFCPQCGTGLVLKPEGDRLRHTCPACSFIYYLNPVVAAAALVEEQGRVVLVKRGVAPRAGYWCLPAGYVEADETAEEAAIRETREEAGLDIAVDDLLGVYSFGGGDFPRGVLIVYSSQRISGAPRPGDDAVEAAFFAPDELPPDAEIAFWTHREVLNDWRRAKAITYRLAQDQEAEAVAALAATHQRPLWEGDRHRARPEDRLLVAMDRGQVIGYASVTLAPEGQATLEYVFVTPNYRRWGIGTRLIEQCLDLARSSGMESMVAQVEAGNPAVAVYLKAGFRVCGFASAPAARRDEAVLFVACSLQEAAPLGGTSSV